MPLAYCVHNYYAIVSCFVMCCGVCVGADSHGLCGNGTIAASYLAPAMLLAAGRQPPLVTLHEQPYYTSFGLHIVKAYKKSGPAELAQSISSGDLQSACCSPCQCVVLFPDRH